MTWTNRPAVGVGRPMRGDEKEAILDEIGSLNLRGYVGEDMEATTNATSTGTEAFSAATVTWTAQPNERYKFTFSSSVFSTVSGDVSRFRIRYQAGASVTSSGTSLRLKSFRHEAASSGDDYSMVATVTGLTGQYTAGASIIRVAGTGTCTISSSATDETYFLVERIA